MLKKILLILGIVFGLIFLAVGVAALYFLPTKDTVLNFIKENSDRTSIKLIRNGQIIVERNADAQMPLASIVKVILAIEYAEQAANQLINPEQLVSLDELNKYYIPKTDGGSHEEWLASIKDKISHQKIPLKYVVKGMMQFSSNANTEWLSEKLGLNNINDRLDSLGMKNHSKIYYLVSAIFVGKEKFPKLKGKELESKLRELTIEEYSNITNQIHQKLKLNRGYKHSLGNFDLNIQRVWSDNLPHSTVSEYTELIRRLNSKTYFSVEVQKYLDEVLETVMENRKHQQWLKHAGMKGGATSFVLTKFLYAIDKNDNETELVYFMNDLNVLENMKLSGSMNEFELNLLVSEDFVNKVRIKLKD